ncbi:MAG: hypothetical protein ACO376_00135 [Gammaproteobacteria bacterium]
MTNPDHIKKTSKLCRGQGRTLFWQAENDQLVELPAVLDLQWTHSETGEVLFRVDAEISLVQNEPRLTCLKIDARKGLDIAALQASFRWQTPLDVIRKTVPALLARGIDPFEYEYSPDGYPDAADIEKKPTQRLSDAFLEELAEEYLKIGRGYAKHIAQIRGVSARTVVNWVEKARQRGILTPVKRGQCGGEIIPIELRKSMGPD